MHVTEQAEQWGFLCESLGLDADDLRRRSARCRRSSPVGFELSPRQAFSPPLPYPVV